MWRKGLGVPSLDLPEVHTYRLRGITWQFLPILPTSPPRASAPLSRLSRIRLSVPGLPNFSASPEVRVEPSQGWPVPALFRPPELARGLGSYAESQYREEAREYSVLLGPIPNTMIPRVPRRATLKKFKTGHAEGAQPSWVPFQIFSS